MSIDNHTTILAVETCTTICSVALWDGKQVHQNIVESDRSHSQQLLPMCEELLNQSGMSMADVGAIGCTRGPGAFTGLRIGVGVAKGLAFGQDLPIYAVSSLQALAHRAAVETNAQHIMALLDARMGELYCAEYRLHEGIPVASGAEMLTDIQKLTLGDQLCVGTGAQVYREELLDAGAEVADVLYPTAADIIALAQASDIEPVSASALAPVYLRNKVTY